MKNFFRSGFWEVRNPSNLGNSESNDKIRYPKLINGIEDHAFGQTHSKSLG